MILFGAAKDGEVVSRDREFFIEGGRVLSIEQWIIGMSDVVDFVEDRYEGDIGVGYLEVGDWDEVAWIWAFIIGGV